VRARHRVGRAGQGHLAQQTISTKSFGSNSISITGTRDKKELGGDAPRDTVIAEEPWTHRYPRMGHCEVSRERLVDAGLVRKHGEEQRHRMRRPYPHDAQRQECLVAAKVSSAG
jgi:hypothetical protein